jgi:hypothetical protein
MRFIFDRDDQGIAVAHSHDFLGDTAYEQMI